jgi:hypothetical protein
MFQEIESVLGSSGRLSSGSLERMTTTFFLFLILLNSSMFQEIESVLGSCGRLTSASLDGMTTTFSFFSFFYFLHVPGDRVGVG